MIIHRGRLLTLALSTLVPGCEREPVNPTPVSRRETADGTSDRPSPAGPDGAAVERGPASNVNFPGAALVRGEDRAIVVSWTTTAPSQDGSAPDRCRIYLAPEHGLIDYSRPSIEVAASAKFVRIPGLNNSETLRVGVRIVDDRGREDHNELAWLVTPNPVVYVSPNAAAAGDGRSPQSPLRSIRLAVEQSIDSAGVNIYAAAGDYSEPLVLFDGMVIYGGFADDFTSEPHDTTRLMSEAFEDLIRVAPGDRWSGLVRIDLDGQGKASRGVVLDDGRMFLAHCQVSGFVRNGIHLRANEDDFSMVRARLLECAIRSNQGEGLALEGAARVRVERCSFVDNGQEGLDADPLRVVQGRHSMLTIDECEFLGNGRKGVNVNLTASDNLETSPISVDLTRSLLYGNRGHGASIDVEYQANPLIRLAVRVHDCISARNGTGIHLDLDSEALWCIGQTLIARNRGPGLSITGDREGSLAAIHELELLDNGGPGLELDAPALIAVNHCDLLGNSTPIDAEAGVVIMNGCNLEPSAPDAAIRATDCNWITDRKVPSAVALMSVSNRGRVAIDRTEQFQSGQVVRVGWERQRRTLSRVGETIAFTEPEPVDRLRAVLVTPSRLRTGGPCQGRSRWIRVSPLPGDQLPSRWTAECWPERIDGASLRLMDGGRELARAGQPALGKFELTLPETVTTKVVRLVLGDETNTELELQYGADD